MNNWMNEWMNKWMNKWMNEWNEMIRTTHSHTITTTYCGYKILAHMWHITDHWHKANTNFYTISIHFEHWDKQWVSNIYINERNELS